MERGTKGCLVENINYHENHRLGFWGAHEIFSKQNDNLNLKKQKMFCKCRLDLCFILELLFGLGYDVLTPTHLSWIKNIHDKGIEFSENSA